MSDPTEPDPFAEDPVAPIAIPTYIDVEEFRQQGYLQECNRRFFHPLGLALAIDVDPETGKATRITGVLDDRGDPEGWTYETLDPVKAQNVEDKLRERAPRRKALLGSIVQPVHPPESSE